MITKYRSRKCSHICILEKRGHQGSDPYGLLKNNEANIWNSEWRIQNQQVLNRVGGKNIWNTTLLISHMPCTPYARIMNSKCGISAMKRPHRKGFWVGQTTFSPRHGTPFPHVSLYFISWPKPQLRPKPHFESLVRIGTLTIQKKFSWQSRTIYQ